MALIIRRGLDIERQSVVFAEGEPLYTTDTKKMYVGDGITVGGNLVSGISSLIEDPSPRISNNLDLNSHKITGAGDIEIQGSINVTGGLSAGYINADYRGSLFGDDSSLIVNAVENSLHASVYAQDGTILVDVVSKQVDLSNTSIDSLNNVDAYSPNEGDSLLYETGTWKSKPFGSMSGNAPANKSMLQWQENAGWIESSLVLSATDDSMFDMNTGEIFLGKSSIKTFNDVFIDEEFLQPNEVLTWDGNNWTHKVVNVDDVDFSNVPINGLSDVFTPTPNVHEVLTWDGNQWISQAPEIGATGVDDLDDTFIDTNSLAVDHVLAWNGSSWTNQPQIDTGATSVDDLDDIFVDTNSLAVDNVLAWNGSSWTNQPQMVRVYGVDDLDDIFVDANSLAVDDVLAWNGSSWTNQAQIDTGATSVDDLDDVAINVTSLAPDDTLIWNGSSWSNGRLSIIKGDVISEDDDIIIDAHDNSVNCLNLVADKGDISSLTSDEVISTEITVERSNNPSVLINRTDDSLTFAGSSERLGLIRFSSTSALDATNEIRSGFIVGFTDKLLISHSSTGDGSVSADYLTISNGNLNIGNSSPALERLEVQGNAKVNGFVQFGTFTTVERDALTATNGMVIYNSTDDKFQGYAASTWINLH